MTTTTRAQRVIGVRSRNTDAILYFDPGDLEFPVGDKVVVDAAVGPDLGTVALEQHGPDHFSRTAEFAMRCRARGAGRGPGS